MAEIEVLSGSGFLVMGKSRTPVTYVIHVLEGLGGMKSAQGTIKGAVSELQPAFDAEGRITLEMEEGLSATVVMQGLNPDGTSEVLVTGPIQ